jgi:hypothetical protein
MLWAGHGDLTSEFTTYGFFGPVGKDTKLPVSRTNPPGYDLWVWSGPAETLYGLMGADLREMDRAHRLGWYPRQRDAKEAADAFHTTGVFGKLKASRRKQVYKITYPNGKIYVGMDLTGSVLYFGRPSAAEEIAADHQLDRSNLTFTLHKEILWESDTATNAEVRAKERELIAAAGANNPEVGYNRTPRFKAPLRP